MLDFKGYINDNEFRINLYKDRINIVNYKEILGINNKEIIVKSNDSKIIINGENLVLSKLLDFEILIIGTVLKIEVTYETI